MNIADITTTDNYDADRIVEIAGRYTNFTSEALVDIRNDYNADILRLELELESARTRSAIATAVLATR